MSLQCNALAGVPTRQDQMKMQFDQIHLDSCTGDVEALISAAAAKTAQVQLGDTLLSSMLMQQLKHLQVPPHSGLPEWPR